MLEIAEVDPKGPQVDHSTGTVNGHLTYMLSSKSRWGKSAVMVSEVMSMMFCHSL